MHPRTPLALAVALAFAASASAQAPAAAAPGGPQPPALGYTNVHPNDVLPAGLPLQFTLAAPMQPAQGNLTLLVNGNDVGSFLQTGDAQSFVLQPADFPLPAGPLQLELVFEPAGGGAPVTLLFARLLVQAPGDLPDHQPDPGVPPDATALAGAGTNGQPQDGQVGSAPVTPSGFVPKATLTGSSLWGARTVNGAQSDSVARELALQLGLRYDAPDVDGRRIALGANFVGDSRSEKDVRYSQAGTAAEKLDVNDYLLEFQTVTARLSLGHTSIAGNPLLGQAFSNRGISGAYRFNPFLDVALASQSASALVGGHDLTGLTNPEQRVTAATVGWEVLPDTPGALRVEATGMSGELVLHAGSAPPGASAGSSSERSHGGGLRVAWAPVNTIYQFEAAYAQSTDIQRDAFGNDQAAAGRQAYFVDGSAKVLDLPATPQRGPRRLVLHLRHEFADTGFRSIAGGMTGDVQRTLVGTDGQVGALQGQWNHSFARNNVDRNPGLPVLETSSDLLNLSLPLAQLLEPPLPPRPSPDQAPAPNALAVATPPGSWWPTLQFGLQRNRQSPLSLPQAVLPSLVPAAATATTTLNAQWSRGTWSWSAGLTAGSVDNRQPGAENQDQRSRGGQLQLQWNPLPTVNATLGLRRARTLATDTGIAQLQNGADLGLNWQFDAGWTLFAQYGRNGNWDSVASQQSRGSNWQLQLGRTFNVPLAPAHVVPVQLSVRWQQQDDWSLSNLNGLLSQNGQRARWAGLVLSATL